MQNPATSANPDAVQQEWEKKAHLYLAHPAECPELVGSLPYLIHPPGKLGSTAAWIEFRDETLVPLVEALPDDPNLPNFLRQAEAILAWRATIPPQDRFWKE